MAFLKLGLSDNVRYTYDPDRPLGDRILDIWVDGELIDPSATYTLTAGNSLLGGGDAFTALRKGTNSFDTGLIDTEVFVNYLRAADGVIAPSFEKNGAAITDGPRTVARDTDVTLVVEGVDLTSSKAPANTQFEVVVDGFVIGTAEIKTEHVAGIPTRDGVSTVVMNVSKFWIADTVELVAKESGTTVTLPLAQLPVKVFSDVAAGADFYTEITWVGSTGISTGWDEDNTYRPVQAIDRNAMAAFLYRLAGEPTWDAPAASPFVDVKPTDPYYKEITWLAASNITKGWNDGTFRPWEPINRDAMAAYLYRFVDNLGLPQID